LKNQDGEEAVSKSNVVFASLKELMSVAKLQPYVLQATKHRFTVDKPMLYDIQTGGFL
jgi:hypothetical protein